MSYPIPTNCKKISPVVCLKQQKTSKKINTIKNFKKYSEKSRYKQQKKVSRKNTSSKNKFNK